MFAILPTTISYNYLSLKAQIQIKLVENLCMLQKFHLKRFFLDVINTIVKNAINRSKEQILMMTKKISYFDCQINPNTF